MKKTVAEYLAMGMDEKTARYFADGRRRIVSAKPLQGYTILLSFDNGEHRVLDCSAKFTEGSVFNKLSAPEAFNRVFVDDGRGFTGVVTGAGRFKDLSRSIGLTVVVR